MKKYLLMVLPLFISYKGLLLMDSGDSYDVLFEPRNSNDHAATDYIAHSSRIINDERPYSIRSSIDVPDVTQQSTLMSQRHRPPLQVMDRCSGACEHERNSSSVFTANSTPQEWSVVSNESLFSLQEDHVCHDNGGLITGAISDESSDFSLSEDVMSDRPSMVAQQETAGAVDRHDEEAGPSIDDNSGREFIVQKTHNHNDANARLPEMSWGFCKTKAKSQPLPSLVIKKPERPSSSCKTAKKGSCCLCSCASLSSCCLTSSFPCKMPTCSSCCFNNCFDWSCCCCCFTKGSCCQNCSKCCWNWSCWRLFCCWNWNYWYKGSCCPGWSCSPCCDSWSCYSKGSCCKPWRCPTGACWYSRISCL